MPLSDVSLTVSDFDPEHEALASTRELGSPQLPRMRHSHEEPDFAINTSTLERAFPEFSQLPTSEEEDEAFEREEEERAMSDPESDLSMELGRGVGKARNRLDDSRSSVMSFQNSVRSSSPAVRVDYPTPQKQQSPRSSTRRAASENLRKDAQLRRASQAQMEKMNAQASNKTGREQRRTFSDMHARVRDNYDGSFLADERPMPVDIKTRSTRFSYPGNSQEIAGAIERASREAYEKERNGHSTGTPRKHASATHNSNNNNTIGDSVTRQSFLLPDLPNISELVSGVYEDGTPVFPRQHKMRSTRFVSPPHDVTETSVTREHIPLDAIPIPEDEKALFVSLRLLQDKVAELEMFKSDAEKRIQNYREENAALKAGRSRRSDKYQVDDVPSKGASRRLTNDYQSWSSYHSF